MNTQHYYCLLSEVMPKHYPMIFEIAGEVLNENTIINLEHILNLARKDAFWNFFFIEPSERGTPPSHWNFGTERYAKNTGAIYLFNPSLSVEEVLFLQSLGT